MNTHSKSNKNTMSNLQHEFKIENQIKTKTENHSEPSEPLGYPKDQQEYLTLDDYNILFQDIMQIDEDFNEDIEELEECEYDMDEYTFKIDNCDYFYTFKIRKVKTITLRITSFLFKLIF